MLSFYFTEKHIHTITCFTKKKVSVPAQISLRKKFPSATGEKAIWISGKT